MTIYSPGLPTWVAQIALIAVLIPTVCLGQPTQSMQTEVCPHCSRSTPSSEGAGMSRSVNDAINGGNLRAIDRGAAEQAAIGGMIAETRALAAANEAARAASATTSAAQPTSPDLRLPNINSTPQATARAVPLGQTGRAFGHSTYVFKTMDPQLRGRLERIYERYWYADAVGAKPRRIRWLGIQSIQLADQAFAEQKLKEGAYFLSIVESMLDMLVGLDPLTGLGRDTYELITGKNLITGALLSDFERGMAFLGVASVGTLSTANRIGQRVVKLAAKAGHLDKALIRTVQTSSSMVTLNRKSGLAFERQVKELMKGKGVVEEQVTLRHLSGAVVRIDFAFMDTSKRLHLIEAKSGGALLSASQDLFFRLSRTDEWEVRTSKMVSLGLRKGEFLPKSAGKRWIGGDSSYNLD